jgi:hypothetical protein
VPVLLAGFVDPEVVVVVVVVAVGFDGTLVSATAVSIVFGFGSDVGLAAGGVDSCDGVFEGVPLSLLMRNLPS